MEPKNRLKLDISRNRRNRHNRHHNRRHHYCRHSHHWLCLAVLFLKKLPQMKQKR
jgi:hypothetical protein